MCVRACLYVYIGEGHETGCIDPWLVKGVRLNGIDLCKALFSLHGHRREEREEEEEEKKEFIANQDQECRAKNFFTASQKK